MSLEVLKAEMDYYLMLCHKATNQFDQRIMCERAFGAVQHHFMLFPQEQDEAGRLWETYKPQFEKIIFKNNA
ncbi:MAG: hypothetical protein J6R67_02975 [Treponema sp.]|nr:hypothetical protein [Treponema sp.]